MNLPFERVLVREVNWIGDAVMTLPALSFIRNRWPEAQISVLARPWVADLFRHHPAVDEILIYDHRGQHKGATGKWSLAQELRKRSFDLALLLQNAFDAAALSFLARIPVRVGYDRDGRGWLLTDAVPLRNDPVVRHHVNYYLDLLEGWLGEDPRASVPTRLRLYISPEEEDWADRFLRKLGIASSGFVGINPGATYGSSKRWFPERFAAVADELKNQTGSEIVLFGGPTESGIAEEIARKMKGQAHVLAGRTSIRELMTLISRCRLFITNDSGPMHIAAAFDIPLVALFGSTSSEATGPYSRRSRVVQAEGPECRPCFLRECSKKNLECMTRISVESVTKAAMDLYREE